MSHEPPKLYVNKPKKAQLKPVLQHNLKEMESATATTTTGSTTIAGGGGGGSAASKPPLPPRESFIRRYKFLWPLLLGVNLAVGAYVFARTKKKEIPVEEEAPTAKPSVISTTAAEQPIPSPPSEPVKLREPIPENQQRELYKWMLEEKRKIKPKDSEEKKRLDEEKAILKQFLRAKSIPAF